MHLKNTKWKNKNYEMSMKSKLNIPAIYYN